MEIDVSLSGRIRRRLSTALPFAALGAALTLVMGACGGSSRPIRLGLVGTFNDPIGVPMRQAARLAVEEIKAAGGIGGRPLELVEHDDLGSTDSAVVVANALYRSDVVAVIGPIFSGPTLAAAPVFNGGSDPVVQLSPSASAPAVSDAGPWTFRMCPSDQAHGAALAQWARQRLNFRRAAVLYLNDIYGRGVRQTFVQRFTELDGTVVQVDPYLGDTPEVGPYLDRLAQRGGADFLVVAGYIDDAASILREARRRNLTMPIMGGDGLEGIDKLGPISDGSYTSGAYFPTLNTPANRKFVDSYTRKYPGDGAPNQPAAGAYDAVYLLRDVIARAGTDRRKIRDALASVGRKDGLPEFIGVGGGVAFDSLGDVPRRAVYIGMVRDGKVLPAGGL
jgi:branched-chain amino acid transport system substrate-binding protein